MPFRKQLTLFDDYRDMLEDRVRMDAYERAIATTVRPGDRVLDLGAGLGILGFLALRAGASRVYAIEQSDSIELARRVAQHNGLADRVEFLAANSLDCTLDPVDVLVSETLGSFGVEENTLPFTIDARRRLLKPGGAMLPRRLRVFLAPIEAPQSWERLGFWLDVAGIDYAPAVDEILSRMSLADVTPDQLLAAPRVYADLDLRTLESPSLDSTVLFPIRRRGAVHGLAGWFEAELADGVAIRTGPDDPSTHWRQAFFPVRDPVPLREGDFMEVTLSVEPKGPRSDDTVVCYDYRCTQIGGRILAPEVP